MSSTSTEVLSTSTQTDESLSGNDAKILDKFKSMNFIFKPKLDEMREKFKNDPEDSSMIVEQLDLLRKEVSGFRTAIEQYLEARENQEGLSEEMRMDVNFKKFLVLICKELYEFIIKIYDFFLARRKNLQKDYLQIWIIGYQLGLIAFALQNVDLPSFPMIFPLFKYLNKVSSGNQFVIARNIWKIAAVPIEDSTLSSTPEICKFHLIVIQSLSDPICYFDTNLNHAQKLTEKDQEIENIKFEPTKYRSFFSGHYTPSNWITSNSTLFKRFELPYEESFCEATQIVLIDLFTYTILLMFDIDKNQGRFGGFADILLRRSDYYVTLDFQTNFFEKESFSKKYPEKSAEDFYRIIQDFRTRVLSISCEFFVESDKFEKLLNQFMTTCQNIWIVEQKESEAYQTFLETNPEIEVLTKHLAEKNLIE